MGVHISDSASNRSQRIRGVINRQIMEINTEERTSWLDRPLFSMSSINWETVIFAIILILAVITRFYNLEARVMSHDETSHVYFSWLYEQGRGYSHDPVTHGPLQFHLVALSYLLFGDSDFSARIPAALFSVATIAFMWFYRRLIGRTGALIAAALLLISPYLLYYGRYVRNEAFVAFFGVVAFWAIIRYLESGASRYLFWLTAATALHFTTKETSFIYAAQTLLFLGLYLIVQIYKKSWPKPEHRNRFLIALLISALLIGIGGAILLSSRGNALPPTPVNTSPTAEGVAPVPPQGPPPIALLLMGLGTLPLLAAIYFALRGYTWERIRSERALGALVVLGTAVLPILSAFPVKFLGYNPIDYNNPQTRIVTAIVVAAMVMLAAVIGVLWNWRLWLMNMALFFGIFTVFYTSLFTNGFGFVTGLVGSLGYWLEQQGVNRGSQPWYYYSLVQVPIYEYLPALGTILTIIFGPRLLRSARQREEMQASDLPAVDINADVEDRPQPETTVALLVFWSITSLLAYSLAGEKMPWLTVHITLAMIITTGWFLGQLVETTDWSAFTRQHGWLVLVLIPVFFVSLSGVMAALLGTNPPFQGKELEQLRSTTTFVTALITAIASGAGLLYLVRNWSSTQLGHVVTLAAFALMGILTARTAFTASYINYDNANEPLVYAHSASGPKVALAQIEEISRRTTDGLALKVAYDNETTYPFWWYLRNYTNQDYYDRTPTRAQRDAPVILVGEGNFDKIEPVVGQAYNRYDYIRLWWPNQDYFDITWQRTLDALTDPTMREALFQIWLNRDYTLYGQATNKDMSFPNWYPASKMRLYVRKDIANSLWNYGVTPSAEAVVADPYEGKQLAIVADRSIGAPGTGQGQFQRPRDLQIAPDGSIYVADTNNHRIQHLDPEGNVINIWGSFADISKGDAPGGTFYEPWGIALGSDGSVFVADTWNHRIQKFSPSGEFIKMWGYFGQAEKPEAFWGPRDVLVTPDDKVVVTDTGNKRIVVFDTDGNFITEFGEPGLGPGQFDEQVGLGVNSDGTLFVADTWNQRIQSFIAAADNSYQPLSSWDIVGWYGQSLDNKPYLAVDSKGTIYAGDPEGYRVLQFSPQGEFIRYWGDLSTGLDGFGLVGGLAVDPQDGIWVSDTGNSRLLHFTLPQP